MAQAKSFGLRTWLATACSTILVLAIAGPAHGAADPVSLSDGVTLKAGDLLVADRDSADLGAIIHVDRFSGSQTPLVRTPRPEGVEVGGDGKVYFNMRGESRLWTWDPRNGKVTSVHPGSVYPHFVNAHGELRAYARRAFFVKDLDLGNVIWRLDRDRPPQVRTRLAHCPFCVPKDRHVHAAAYRVYAMGAGPAGRPILAGRFDTDGDHEPDAWQLVTATGKLTHQVESTGGYLAGGHTDQFAVFNGVTSLVPNPAGAKPRGAVFATNNMGPFGTGSLFRINRDGSQTLLSAGAEDGGKFTGPEGLDIDAKGKLFIVDPDWKSAVGHPSLIRINPKTGTQTVVSSRQHFASPVAVDVIPPSCRRAMATMVGGRGGGLVRGTPFDDVIVGSPGDDTIRGGKGDDLICSDDGADRVLGGLGRDVLIGGRGPDHLQGGRGRDILIGGAGRDTRKP